VWFHRLDRSVQLALIGAALAGGGCYVSHGDEDDADGDARDAEADAEADAAWEGVDPAPYPLCTTVSEYGLLTETVEQTEDYAVAELRVDGYYDAPGDTCAAPPCLTVTPDAGHGTIGDVTLRSPGVARFRYTNPSLGWGEPPVRLDLQWRLFCREGAPWPPGERTLSGTAWACRDDSYRLLVVSDPEQCATVVDVAPAPMARAEPGSAPGASSGPLRLSAREQDDGRWLLQARGALLPGTRYRWVASGGALRLLSDAQAVFEPAAEARVVMVQVAAFTPDGMTVQVFRRQRG
jgi:hypothetical protein